MKNILRIKVVAISLLLTNAGLNAQTSQVAGSSAKQARPYPMNTCLVSGGKLGSMGEPSVHIHKGQEIKFCCQGCLNPFLQDTGKYLKKVKEAHAKVKPYPKETCLVSGRKLDGKLGTSHIFIDEGREIKLCCKGCLPKYKQSSAKYLTAFDSAFAKVKRYTSETCLVSGQKLGSMGAPLAFIHEGMEVKLCCKGCIKAFQKNTDKYVKKLAKASGK
jgi:YHS domain-containing protein